MYILFLIAGDGFQPIEYGVPKKILENGGHVVVTGSDVNGEAIASDGSRVVVDIVLEDVELAKYGAVFIIGGPGALKHLEVQETNRILSEAMLREIPYGAICISPRILARAHVLVGKKATGWDDDEKLSQIFDENNVEYVHESVVVDGNVVTASGPSAAEGFGHAILDVLKK
jgi:protease I